MRYRTGRMAVLTTRASVATTVALLLAMLGATMAREQRRPVAG